MALSPTSARHRLGRWLAAALLATAMAATVTGPAAAAPLGTDPAAATSAAVPLAAAPADPGISTEVLLLSGDRVTHTAHPDGTVTVVVDAAERPDGTPAAFETVESEHGYFVIPSDARPLLSGGMLDEQLFNVTALVEDGLADRDGLPVIVKGGAGGAALTAAEQTATLTSIGGAGLRLDRDDATRWWRGLTDAGDQPRTAAGLPERIWLDRAVRVELAESVPQIGAPEVWDTGFDGAGVTVAVLDTGVDPDHPDLQGRVVATENFTSDPIADGHGHGTHVASTVAGSGAASGDVRRGVAPAADLLIGKVLPDSGTGPTSAVIEGMQWAAHAGADIINLSVGGPVTDGTDPASLAVEALTDETGALFVVAAGNNLGDAAITAPGAATSALTVGAVDKQDQLAFFSNRGPRRGDAAVKPELTAPGNAIVAARAAGTSMGVPVDDFYTSANGTSMATPHVAGAAALLAQARPDWTWDQLKDALVTTAEPGDYPVFQGGAGRLDVARAVAAGVSGPATVNVGTFDAPYEEQRTAHLTYRNSTAEDVTLTLDLSGRSWSGQDLPEGAVSLAADAVTVPAGEAATVALTVDAVPGDVGAYAGTVVASAGELALRTPFGYYKSTGSNQLTVRAVDFRGDPAPDVPLRAVKLDGALDNDPFHGAETWDWSDSDGQVQLSVADGRYDVYGNLNNSWDLHTNRLTSVVATELAVGQDTTVDLDGAAAVVVDPHWPEPTDLKASAASYRRGFEGGEFATGWGVQYSPTSLYMQPAEYTTGWLEVTENWQVASSLISTAEVRAGSATQSITPGYHNLFAAPALAGTHDLPLVWAGTGTPQELADADIAGKAGLVRIPLPEDPQPNPPSYVFATFNQITSDAIAAGAAGLVLYVDEPGALGIPGDGPHSADLLQLSIPFEEGAAVRGLLEDDEAAVARLALAATRDPERIYRVREWHEDPTMPQARRQVEADDLIEVATRYHADAPDHLLSSFSNAFTPREQVVAGLTPRYWSGFAVTEYILPGEHLRWHRQAEQLGPQPGTAAANPLETREMFLPGDRRAPQTWFGSPMSTGAADVPTDTQWFELLCSFCRQGDQFAPGRYYLDSDPRHYRRSFLQEGTSYRLYSGDEEIPNSGSGTAPWFALDPAPGTYRLEQVSIQPGVPGVRTLAPRIDTSWTFRSQRLHADTTPDGYSCPFAGDAGCAFQPLLQLDYQLGLDLLNRAPAGGSHTFRVEVAPHSATDGHGARPVPWFDVWYSVDGGQTWQPARTRPDRGPTTFRVTVDHPALSDTDGYVWLRADVRDVAGNRVEQTIQRAYSLH